jgi:hypothetical protein
MVLRASSKRRGRNLENKVVSDLQEAGFAAEKIPYQQARRSDHSVGGDVSVPLCGVDRFIECKAHKQGFEPVYRALDKADVAVVRGHHKEPVVIVRWSTWLEHIKLAESYRAPPVDPSVQVIEFKDAAE